MVLTHRFLFVPLIAALLLLAAGCGEQPQIAEYDAPKIPEAAPQPRSQRPSAATGSAAQRMLGAIISGPAQKAWFLKVTGSDAAIEGMLAGFRQFAAAWKFNDQGQPEWQLPQGWEELPGDGIRYRTLRIAQTPPLDVSVTTLDASGDWDAYVLANLNRWRGQMNLPPVESADLAQQVEQLTSEHGVPVSLVDYRDPTATGTTGPTTNGPAGNELVTHAPDEWRPGQLNSLRSAAFEVQLGEHRAEITVTKLSAAGGDVPANVNRWRGQIGLPPASPAEIMSDAKTLDVLGSKAVYVHLKGPATQAPATSILGLIAPHRDVVWFVKMTGESQLVEQERERFETFAESLELR
jgi:hypothetical protein